LHKVKKRSTKNCIECKRKPKHLAYARCNECHRKKVNKTHTIEEQKKDKRAKNYLARRTYVYKSRYNITEEQYQQVLEKQDHKCAICLTHQDDQKIRMSVDHNHNCCPGLFTCGNCLRGLLCRSCNLALGGFKDNKVIIQNAINYLLQFESKEK
jgi:hypothetical protein